MRDRLPARASHSNELRQHLHTLHTSLEAERTRIARELHDELGQALTALKMDIAWLTRRMRAEAPANAMILPRLSEMSAFVDATIDSVRRIATDLRPAPLDAMGLNVALETHARRLAARAGLKLYVDICADAPLTLEQATGLFRIGQEALTNVVRHAHASGIWICLSQSAAGLELRIRDDGRGIPTRATDPSARTSGLTGMRERAALLGATFEASPSPQGGTLVRVHLPATTDPTSVL